MVNAICAGCCHQGKGVVPVKTTDVRNALKSRLASGSYPFRTGIAWPNIDYSGARPYFDISFTGVARVGDGVQGDEILEETGQFNAVVVVDRGVGEDDAHGLADTVAALFPEGLNLAISGASIAVIQPTEIRGGFPSDADYRVPVAVRYHALRD